MLLYWIICWVIIIEEGEWIYEWVQCILQDVDEMMDEFFDVCQVLQGMLCIISSFGFGCWVVVLVLLVLVFQYLQLELCFDVQDWLVDLVNEGVDFDICVGDDIVLNLIVCQLVVNYCVFCVLLQFFVCYVLLKQLSDLVVLFCLVIKECDYLFGVW